jgi:hypothetical protein
MSSLHGPDRTGPVQNSMVMIRLTFEPMINRSLTDLRRDSGCSRIRGSEQLIVGTITMAPGSQRNACLSCRQRKLKCDRQQPCANCVARSVECTEQDLPPNRAVKRPLPPEPDSSALSNILSRLDQIETYLSPTKRSKHVSISTPIGNQLNAIRFNLPSVVSQTQEPAFNNVAEFMPPEDQMQATKYSVNDSFLVRF